MRADQSWAGLGTGDWNDAANWTSAVPDAENVTINTSLTEGATIASDFVTTPTDIYITSFAPSGRLDQLSGTASTGSGNWLFMSRNGGDSVFNLADTTTTGGALTGYGLGSGSFTAGNIQAGDPFYNLAGGTATINVNTSGTLHTTGDLNLGQAGATATLNLDAGTVSTGGILRVGANAGGDSSHLTSGIMNQSGGDVTSAGLFIVADASDVANGSQVSGSYNMTGGTVTVGTAEASNQLWVGNNGTGTFNQSGGTVTSTSWFVIGRSTDETNLTGDGTYNLTGGTVNATTVDGNVSIASAGGTGLLNVSGGVFNAKHIILVGEGYKNAGTGTLTVSGSGVVNVSDTGQGVRLAANSGVTGIVNLNGGTLSTPIVTHGGGTSIFNFNGGTLQATASRSDFMSGGLTSANVRNGGAVIDTNGFDVTIAQALTHSDIEGDNATDGGLTKNGVGTLTLTGANTFTGDITINDGTLSINSAFVAAAASVSLLSGTIFDLNYTGTDSIASLFIDGVAQSTGTWGAIGSGADFETALITGSGFLEVASAIPEPASVAAILGGLALVAGALRRRRRNT